MIILFDHFDGAMIRNILETQFSVTTERFNPF